MIDYLVCYADTDAAGVLHHARYIELAEHGYHRWLKHRGLSCGKLGRDYDLSLVVYDIAARYKSAVFLEDEIRIDTRLHALDRTGLEWQTRILRGDDLVFSIVTRMACLAGAARSLVSVPNFLLERLTPEVGRAMFSCAK